MSADCPCACHDLGGGPFHPGEKCRCNGGTGFDDWSDWRVVTEEFDRRLEKATDLLIETYRESSVWYALVQVPRKSWRLQAYMVLLAAGLPDLLEERDRLSRENTQLKDAQDTPYDHWGETA